MKSKSYLIGSILGLVFPSLLLTAQAEPAKDQAKPAATMKVEVKRNLPDVVPAKDVKVEVMQVELEFVTYNQDKSKFVGYYQDGWFEMVSLHDAKSGKQLGSVYCSGGVPKVFRFSKDGKYLGAQASVGWYVWKIPSFEEVFVLGDTDFTR